MAPEQFSSRALYNRNTHNRLQHDPTLSYFSITKNQNDQNPRCSTIMKKFEITQSMESLCFDRALLLDHCSPVQKRQVLYSRGGKLNPDEALFLSAGRGYRGYPAMYTAFFYCFI